MLYKIVNQEVDLDRDKYLFPAVTKTRGSHPLKFQTCATRIDAYKFSFFPRTVLDWNKLHCDTVSAPTLSVFKERIRRD